MSASSTPVRLWACAVLLCGASLAFAPTRGAADPAPPPAWEAQAAAAATRFLEVRRLEVGGRGSGAQMAFGVAERGNWHYVPRRRAGLSFQAMGEPTRAAARGLLRTTLSTEGAAQVEAVMALETLLGELERSRFRDPLDYAVAIFGTPGEAPWGWRLEGHHVSLNATFVAPGRVAFTPFFLGSNPARIPHGPRAGERLQPAEHDLGLTLAQGLTEAQWRQALLAARTPGDVLTGPGRAQSLAAPQGLPVATLDASQQAVLLRLIEAYVRRTPATFADAYLALVRAGWAETRFGWAGARTAGRPFYYRVHGPRILIELDNTQNQANHVHALWRDPLNDFGQDDLARHHAGTHTDLRGR